MASLALIAAGSLAYYPVLFCLPTMLLDGTAAAAGIALINAISSVGGFAGPWFVGAVKDATGGVTGAYLALAALCILAAAVCFALRPKAVFVLPAARTSTVTR